MLLVTTALEETWGGGDEILFLGEWCKLYDRKNVWDNLKSETLPYHWNDRNKLRRDFDRLQRLNDELLIDLARELNRLHGVNYSVKSWRLVIGYWLNLFTAILFDRWEMIQLARKTGKANRILGLHFQPENMIANDSNSFAQLMTQDHWNQYIFQEVVNQCGSAFDIEYISEDKSIELNGAVPYEPTFRLSQYLSRLFYNSLNYLGYITSRDSDPFLIGTYLPIRKLISLQLKLGAMPSLRSSIGVPLVNFDSSMRQWQIPVGYVDDGFESFVRSMIPNQLPKVFVEGYKSIHQLVNKSRVPRNPRFILTANNHYNDDAFKIWAASKIDVGIPFITIEHGGFGSNAFNGGIKYQLDVSDCSLSWGWEEGVRYPQVKAFGFPKFAGNPQKWDPQGFALLVQGDMPRYSFDIRAMALTSQMLEYFEDQYQFYAALPESIQHELLVRLYPGDYGWNQKQRWQDCFPEIRLDQGDVPMSNLIKKSRLYISTYNATTYLESLSMNVPTIMFWNPNHWELRDDAIPYFNRLKEVGIFHETSESAAAKVAEVWDDVSGWWKQPVVQEVRESFCHRFARQIENPMAALKEILEDVVNDKTRSTIN
jgi:putative transferase (TIGR04331 family)